MDASLNRKSLMLGVPGIALQLGGNIMSRGLDEANPDVGMALGALAAILVGTVLLILGLAMYAKAKGRSGWWGLMGFLSIIGLIVLACLKDRNR